MNKTKLAAIKTTATAMSLVLGLGTAPRAALAENDVIATGETSSTMHNVQDTTPEDVASATFVADSTSPGDANAEGMNPTPQQQLEESAVVDAPGVAEQGAVATIPTSDEQTATIDPVAVNPAAEEATTDNPEAAPLEAMAETTVTMYRLYNPYSGEHLYTGSANERDSLGIAGWRYEGVGWIAPRSSKTPVYRLYNPYSGDHHYTVSHDEYDALGSIGWKQEGTGWYSDDSHRMPLYREFNPYARVGTHNYTTGWEEHEALVQAGWNDEGIAWYGVEAGYGLSKPGVGLSFASLGSFASVWLEGGDSELGSIELSVRGSDEDEWQGWVNEGETASAYSALSALRMRLTGTYAMAYDVWYRGYVEQVGWSGWAKNGEGTGSRGLSLGLQEVQVVLMARGSSAPGSTKHAMLDGTYVGKLGYQNPAGFYQVSCKTVAITSAAIPPWNYITPSRIGVWASRDECVGAFLQRAREYLGAPYVWDYSCEPGIGVDCIGLVYQCCYACGMDLGGGTGDDDFNPWAHYITGYDGWHSHDANNFWNYGRAAHVALGSRQPGDLIYWPGHVAIYMGDDTIIEAVMGYGVIYNDLWNRGTPSGCIRLFQ